MSSSESRPRKVELMLTFKKRNDYCEYFTHNNETYTCCYDNQQSSQLKRSVWVRLWHKMSEIGIEMSEILHQHIIHNNNNNSYNITKYSIAIYLATALIVVTVCFVAITCSLFADFSTDKGGSYFSMAVFWFSQLDCQNTWKSPIKLQAWPKFSFIVVTERYLIVARWQTCAC